MLDSLVLHVVSWSFLISRTGEHNFLSGISRSRPRLHLVQQAGATSLVLCAGVIWFSRPIALATRVLVGLEREYGRAGIS